MSEIDTIPEHEEEISAFKNAENKIELLEEFTKTKQADFRVPKAFSLNWFAKWEDEDLGVRPTSKSFDWMRSGGDIRTRLDKALEDCRETLAAIKNLDPKKQTELTSLNAEKADLEMKLRKLAQNVYDLMLENKAYRKQLGIKQAQHQDMQKVKKMRGTDG
jgi:GTP-dependent phosphoenolpyruvate carboxykinase